MTFTLVNEVYEPKVASQKLSYLMLSFAITPGLSVALGGLLITYFSWDSCFYFSAFYGVALLLLTMRLPETISKIDKDALSLAHLWKGYAVQFTNKSLLLGGFLMGSSSCFVYLFASLSPFISMQILGMSSFAYGLANLLPSMGLVLGSIVSARMIKRYSLMSMVKLSVAIIGLGTIILYILLSLSLPPVVGIFLPMIIIYFGLCFIFSNASVVALEKTDDKAHGSAVMSFLNMGMATFVVLLTERFTVAKLLLPEVYVLVSIFMLGLLLMLKKSKAN